MEIIITKVLDTKKHKKLLSKMTKGFNKDYANAGDNINPTSHNKLAKKTMKSKRYAPNFIVDKHSLEIVGYTIVENKGMFVGIQVVYVLPEYRGKGYAKLVYQYIMSIAEQTSISLSMRRAKEKSKFFKDLGFTNFMPDIKVDHNGMVISRQVSDRGLCNLSTWGMFDNTVENISKWQQLAANNPLSSVDRENKLMAELSINDTTQELEVA